MRIESGGGVGGPGGGGNLLEHCVQNGDTLESIATQYDVTKQALLETNRNITSETLQPGQILQIPQTATPQAPATPAADQVESFIPHDLLGFAPPYVPVGPIVAGDNVAGNIREPESSSEVTHVSLTADQFQINQEGNLVIKNPELIQFFKTLTEKASEGQDVMLGITQLKPPEEE